MTSIATSGVAISREGDLVFRNVIESELTIALRLLQLLKRWEHVHIH